MQTHKQKVKHLLLTTLFSLYGCYIQAQSNWGTKVASASESGATEIRSVIDGFISLAHWCWAFENLVFLANGYPILHPQRRESTSLF